MLLQLLFVLVAIIIGARVGGIGLGILGGLGLAVLTFVFGLQPTAPPIDVMLMIVAVIAAASCMQAAGGLDLMVKWAEKILRKNPHHITLLSPFVTYFFTFLQEQDMWLILFFPLLPRLPKIQVFVLNVRWVSQLSLRSRLLLPARYRQQRLLCSVCLPDIIFRCSIS